jgi:hypothetical protein
MRADLCVPRRSFYKGVTMTTLNRGLLKILSKSNGSEDASLFLTISKDGGALFDPQQDRMLKLNRIGAEMWRLLSSGSTELQVAEVVAHEYGVERETVTDDLHSLLKRAQQMDLGAGPRSTLIIKQTDPLCSDKAQPAFPWYAQDFDHPRPKSNTVSVVEAFFNLFLFDLALSAGSLKYVCEFVKARPVAAAAQRPAGNLTGAICGAVERACVLYPKKAVCLQRSAVLTCMLRRAGIPAHMVLGVRIMPFLAHAWVEANGTVLNDFSKVASFYQAVASY